MAPRIVIQHLGGSKANQVEQFPTDTVTELTIGREPGSTIVFDATRDDAVSRRHAVIKVETTREPTFKLADVGSRNGTLLNGQRITGESELLPGDIIELGVGGPKFAFDLDPRPANLTARTRVITTNAPSPETRALNTATQPVTTTAMIPNASGGKTGVGRDTVMHMLAEQRQTTSRIGVFSLAGLLVLIGAVGGVVYYRNHQALLERDAKMAEQAEQLAQQTQAVQQQRAKIEADNTALQKKIGITGQEVIDKFANTTVVIHALWRIYDKETGKTVFHKTWCPKTSVCSRSELLPAYVKWEGKFYRWLTTQDDDHTNFPIGENLSGTGFVINNQGFILTNKHVAAGWLIDYSKSSTYQEGHGVWFQADNRKPQRRFVSAMSQLMHEFDVSEWNSAFKSLIRWHPEEGGPIFANDQPVIIGKGDNTFEGKIEELSARFPGGRSDVSARLVRTSTEADVAMIKVDTTQALTVAPIADADTVKVGEPVVVLGYPSYSPKSKLFYRTVENAEIRNRSDEVPEPTVTSGSISKLGSAPERVGTGAFEQMSEMGDVYQMTVTVGPGSSGGPVFGSDGKVIGLMTYANRQVEAVSYAVPIRYARAVIDLQRSN
jgi:S1-C subfamily serine protease/pSer/pThr/pTyr-binding forkhead associated (FHA) protein